MTTHTNPKMRAGADAIAAGQLAMQRFRFDFADASIRPAAIALNDLIQVAIVPAGHVLVEQLCRISVPALDTNGAPTGDYSIGTEADPDALKGTAASETAVTLFGEDFLLVNGPIGARDAETPIYIKALAASATVPATGAVISDLVYRRWDDAIDG